MNPFERVRAALLISAGALALAGACSDGDDGMGVPDANREPADAGILVDDLSMPAQPTVDSSDFAGAENCGGCHTEHYAQWKTSIHSYSMTDPIYRAIVKVRQEDTNGLEDPFCLQCHTVIGTRSHDIRPGFDFEELEPISLEGVNCETCHKISGVTRPFNAGMELDVSGPMRGTMENPTANGVHESAYSEVHDDSLLCASCHDVIEVSGLNLERPYEEWLQSPAAQDGVTCQTCHMKVYRGRATEDAPERDLHEHYFVGVDLPLTEGYLPSQQDYDNMRQRISELLTGSATVTLEAESGAPGDQVDLFVSVKNNIVAHNIPTGSTFNRQVWLEVIATDADNNVLYETGTLDSNGDLKNYWSDEDPFGDDDLIEFGSRLTDVTGTPTVFSWRATEHHTNSLSPLYDRTATLFIPTTESTNGPIHIEARIRYRGFPPFLLRALELSEYIDKLEIFDIDSISIDVELDEGEP